MGEKDTTGQTDTGRTKRGVGTIAGKEHIREISDACWGGRGVERDMVASNVGSIAS